MDRSRTDRKYTPAEFARLMDEAKARAVQARNDALDAFWKRALAAARRTWERGAPLPGRMRSRFG